MQYRKHKKLAAVVLSAALLGGWGAVVHTQPMGIPSMGAASGAELSPALERTLGDAIMEQGRRDPQYVSDAVVNQYLNQLGQQLAKHSSVPLNYEVSLFGLRDASLNAFALPGGYIGIHTGLIAQARTEAELASVVSHEIAHVALRHVARGMTQGSQSSHIMIASLVASLLAGLAGSGDLAMGIATFGQAAAIDRQLGFSRQAEQEADRVGFQMLQGAGFDPAGMSSMFQLLQEKSRLNMSPNAYATTHPLSAQRMADAENRAYSSKNTQFIENDDFWFVQAAVMVLQAQGGSELERVQQRLQSLAANRSGVAQAAAYYGLAYAAQKRQNITAAQQYLQQAIKVGVPSAALDVLQVELLWAQNQNAQALQKAQAAWQRWPTNQAVALALVEALSKQGDTAKMLPLLQRLVKQWPNEPRFHQLLAHNLNKTGQPIAANEAMAQYYILVGALPSAVDQLQQARDQSTDFYQQSTLDVQIRDLRERLERDRLLLERFRS